MKAAWRTSGQPIRRRTISSEWGKVEFVCCPAGEKQQKRDAALRKLNHNADAGAETNDVSEEYLREQFDEFQFVFGYDAYDEAENWWVEWGMILDRTMSMGMEYSSSCEDVPQESFMYCSRSGEDFAPSTLILCESKSENL